ncbi:MAG: hypothetical protein PHS41_00715 [Victivallaceae bacterium]|nr:hypothetical protein [Victivallaceae bacterium]
MHKRNKILLAAAATCTGLLIFAGTGCVSRPEALEVIYVPHDFKPIEGAKFTLAPVGNLRLIGDLDPRITLCLINAGKSTVRIDEWYMAESDNIKLRYQLWLPGTTAPDPAKWRKIEPVIEKNPARYPIDLMPGNRILITLRLPFVEDLRVSPGKEVRFFLQAETNLKSIHAQTKVFSVSVQ